jgi:hypothetical protein
MLEISKQSSVLVQFVQSSIKKLKASFNSITLPTVIILPHKANNLSTANNHHTIATATTAHTFINIIT